MSPIVEPATLKDVEAIVDAFFAAFASLSAGDMFKPVEGRQWQMAIWTRFLRWQEEGIQEARVFLIRDHQGIAKSTMLLWIAKPGEGGVQAWNKRYPELDLVVDKKQVSEFFDAMQTQHHAVMHDGSHVYLELLFTHPTAQRQGHASALLTKASEVADELDSALYLDSDEKAIKLYEKHEFIGQTHVERTSRMFPMKKPKLSDRK